MERAAQLRLGQAKLGCSKDSDYPIWNSTLASMLTSAVAVSTYPAYRTECYGAYTVSVVYLFFALSPRGPGQCQSAYLWRSHA